MDGREVGPIDLGLGTWRGLDPTSGPHGWSRIGAGPVALDRAQAAGIAVFRRQPRVQDSEVDRTKQQKQRRDHPRHPDALSTHDESQRALAWRRPPCARQPDILILSLYSQGSPVHFILKSLQSPIQFSATA